MNFDNIKVSIFKNMQSYESHPVGLQEIRKQPILTYSPKRLPFQVKRKQPILTYSPKRLPFQVKHIKID